VLQYARWLKEDLGVTKGEVVAIDFLNGHHFVWLWFALWSLGARPAFINYNLTGQPLLHSIKTSSARLVLADVDVRKEFSDVVMAELAKDDFRNDGGSVKTIFLDKSIEDRIAGLEEWREPDESRAGLVATDMALLIYTSGTTGLPKPAVVSWTKLHIGGRFTTGYLPMKRDDILYTVSNPSIGKDLEPLQLPSQMEEV
jgi:acyl-coenzyme A synthetase/AMP-(fatty) acid ligase